MATPTAAMKAPQRPKDPVETIRKDNLPEGETCAIVHSNSYMVCAACQFTIPRDTSTHTNTPAGNGNGSTCGRTITMIDDRRAQPSNGAELNPLPAFYQELRRVKIIG